MLVKSISKSVFGSAVAGFGFSFGRDIYKTGKGKSDSKPFIIVFLLAILSAYLTFMSGLWFARNYKSVFISLLMKVISLGLATAIGFVWLSFFITPNDDQADVAPTTTILIEVLVSNWMFWIPIAIFALGVFVGLIQRKKRKHAWDAESHNAEFLGKNGFSEQDGFIFDGKGQKYRVQSTNTKFIELFAVGKRSRRGYLRLDNTGKITDWSGMVKV